MKFFCVGNCEGVKGSVHVAVGLLLVACCGYNAIAYLTRHPRERHLRRNVIVYGAGVIYEAVQVARHCRAGGRQA